MTVQGRDASDFDWSSGTGPDWAGLAFATNKATEGTNPQWDHVHLAAALTHARDQGVPVLGAYHVVRTPGNAGTGTVAAQVDHYLARLDAAVPWWRNWPAWMHQIDAEHWPYDQVSADTVKAFAARLVATDPHFAVTYASRGQYGDTLAGIVTPLWNADYRASTGGSYPGDGWTATSSGSPAGWAPYSGQVPAFLQYTSTPFDKDAFRGSLDELLALIGGTDMDAVQNYRLKVLFENWDPTRDQWVAAGGDPAVWDAAQAAGTARNGVKQALNTLATGMDGLTKQVTALATAVQAQAAGQPSQDQVNAAVLNAMLDPRVQKGIGDAIAAHLHVA